MELEAIVAPAATKNKAQQKGPDDNRCRMPEPKKKRSVMHLVRVALYMIKSGKSKPVAASKWNKLLGSMRPLHVQSNESPPRLIKDAPPRPTGPPPLTLTQLQFAEQLDSNLTSPRSPAETSVGSASMSQYASALNLHELDDPSDDEQEEETFYDGEGDSMIDTKAEMFIAHFYHQMRLQQEAYTTRRRKERTGE